VFQVPPGETDLDASIALANDPGDELIVSLVDPSGQTVRYSSNYSYEPSGGTFVPAATQYLDVYHVAPDPGQWELLLDWQQPVTGNELDEPFTGAIRFNQVSVTANLPGSASDTIGQGSTADFTVNVDNTGLAPEAFFADPGWTRRPRSACSSGTAPPTPGT
jgi:hypothetical protein